VDQTCDRFEAAWNAGQRPQIEEFLGEATEPERSVLLRKLVALDLDHCRRRGEKPNLEAYLLLFTRDAEWIQAIWRQRTGPTGPPPDRSREEATRIAPAQESPEDPNRTTPYVAGQPAGSAPGEGPAEPAAKVPSIPGYQILGKLGEGGMGMVYKAHHLPLNRQVALKTILPRNELSDEALARFLGEAQAVARLRHPHIVQVHDIGSCGDVPYFCLEFVEGSSLDKKLAGTPQQPRSAAKFVEILARAMHHAHQRRIVHRDLKPANILLVPSERPEAISLGGDDGQAERYEPKITDFGLAKQLDSDQGKTQANVILGTASYMAPEQAAGKSSQSDPLVDVYALGAILYEMLTGRPPFKGATWQDTLEAVRTQEPVPPSRLQPKTPRDLETICLKCLQKEPARRYGSALTLAEDLERFLAGEPIRARPVGALERLWRWCRRHPALAGFGVTALLLLILATAIAVSVAQARAARLEEEVLRSNVYAAQGVASTVIWQLHRLSEPVVQAAEDPKLSRLLQDRQLTRLLQDWQLSRLLQRDKGVALQKYLEKIHRKYADPAHGFARPGGERDFQSWHLLNKDGKLVADTSLRNSSRSPNVLDHSLGWRDYFQGAMRHKGETGRAAAYISRVYTSNTDDLYKIAITVPVRAGPDARSPILGVLAATITTASTLGSLPLNDERRTAVLVGRRDTNAPGGPPAEDLDPEYLVLLHPAYRHGAKAIQVPSDRLRAFHQPGPGSAFRLPASGSGLDPEKAMDSAYEDPVGARDPRYRGRWLAGFATVGNTEFVVIVQQRYDQVVELDILWAGQAFAVGGLLLAGALWYGVQRALQRRPRPA
jgi:serine/threonine-protein kinase